jgi:hypothetical protein
MRTVLLLHGSLGEDGEMMGEPHAWPLLGAESLQDCQFRDFVRGAGSKIVGQFGKRSNLLRDVIGWSG